MRSTTDSAFRVTSRRRGLWAGAAWFQVARELKHSVIEEKRKFSVAETLRQGCANKYPQTFTRPSPRLLDTLQLCQCTWK